MSQVSHHPHGVRNPARKLRDNRSLAVCYQTVSLDDLCVLVVTPDGRSLPVEVMWHGALDRVVLGYNGPSRIRATLLVDLPTNSRKRQEVTV
jgi:hypothetical protein